MTALESFLGAAGFSLRGLSWCSAPLEIEAPRGLKPAAQSLRSSLAETCDRRSSPLIPAIRSSLLGAVILAGCALPPRSAPTSPPGSETRPPYLNARAGVVEYHGPGREDPPPEKVIEVRIGWFGPADSNHPTAGMMWLAATMAVDEANQAGGYRGVPFRLLSAWSENPWDTGIMGLIRLV